MQKPQGYDTTEAKQGGGEFPKVPAGAYILGIISAEETKSKKGNPMLKLRMDIAEGEFYRFYTKLSEKLGKDIYLDYYQLTGGEHLPFFKWAIEMIEKSNVGFKFGFDEKALINKKVGANLYEEEYESNGEIRTSLKVGYLATIEDVRKGLELLPKKLLSGKKISSPETVNPQQSKEDDLPF